MHGGKEIAVTNDVIDSERLPAMLGKVVNGTIRSPFWVSHFTFKVPYYDHSFYSPSSIFAITVSFRCISSFLFGLLLLDFSVFHGRSRHRSFT